MRFVLSANIAVTAICAITAPICTAQPRFEAAAIQVPTPEQRTPIPLSAEKLAVFDSASIKPSNGPLEGGWVRFTPAGVIGRDISARRIILLAYHLGDIQLRGGPGWLDADRFDLEAKAETAANENQLRQMLQKLLAQRFNLAVHRETKEMPVYAMTVGKNGPQLPDWKEGQAEPSRASRAGRILVDRGNTQHFADTLNNSSMIDRLVLDRTGLQGTYYFRVEWNGNDDFMTAIQEQLGLRFEPQKAPMEFLVIDHIEKPGAN